MILTHALDFIGYRCLEQSHRLKGHQIHPKESTDRYFAEDPLELKRITYPLNKDSLVVDLGGFKGEWAQQIYCRYHCLLDIYEPNPILAALIQTKFGRTSGIRVFPVALSDHASTGNLRGSDIYATLHGNSDGEITEVIIDKASDVFKSHYYGKSIDLLKINIEGSEYEVLPDLIANYDMASIKNIQIQFHNMVPRYAIKREQICDALKRTHCCDWCYDYLYESWSAK